MDTRELKDKLLAEKEDLEIKLQEIDCGRITAHDECYGDAADQSQDKDSIGEILRRRNDCRAKIREIDETLDLIARKIYGFCQRCGDSISDDRLEALPHARTHVFCVKATKKRTPSAELSLLFGVAAKAYS